MKARAGQVRFDVHLGETTAAEQLLEDARRCFLETMELPPRWFYDERGCRLFDEITRLEAYYPTRRERQLLEERADEIATITEAGTLVELGSGSSEKTRVLLDAFTRTGMLERYVPFDVSASYLQVAASEIADRYGVDVHAIVGDFERDLHTIPVDDRTIVAFLGSTIGNFEPAARRRFLADLAAATPSGSWLLLGVDLVKDPGRLVAAYDDDEGVTAAFNRNVLRVLNRELGTALDEQAFSHEAIWNAGEERIEMWLRVRRAQRVRFDGVDRRLRAGDAVRTEISCKFRPDGVRDELAIAGFTLGHWWTDPAGDVALTLARRH